MTESKNVDLSQIYGDTLVQDRDGNITIAPAGQFNVAANSTRGNADIVITLPPNFAASVDGRTRNGDIMSDFPLSISGEESKTVSGRIGSGGAKIVVSTEVGDVQIKRGNGLPPPPTRASAPEPPPPPNAPHLKAKGSPPAEVTQ
jgi:hypothetical protein